MTPPAPLPMRRDAPAPAIRLAPDIPEAKSLATETMEAKSLDAKSLNAGTACRKIEPSPKTPSSKPPAPEALKAAEAVRLEGAAKTYGSHTALNPIDLAIEEGRKVVLLGPSGCGKTTTLRLIAGLESPDPGGRVIIGGVDVTKVPPEKRGIGMMFQSYALFPNMSVLENVAYGLKIRKIPKKERLERAGELLSMTRLADFAHGDVTKLSGGQRQRVALARALATEPKVLLLDEPLGALDASLRESVREELDELLTSLAITTVIVTHDQAEAMSLGDVIVVMRGGNIEQIGSPKDIYHEPASAFVAGFVGGSNKIGGTISNGLLSLPGGITISESLIRKPASSANGAFGSPEASSANGSSLARSSSGTSNVYDASDSSSDSDSACSRVAIFFRPDRAALAPASQGLVSGKVISSKFLGGVTRLVVGIGDEVRIKMELADAEGVKAGTEIGLDLSPESLMVFEEA